MLKYLSGTGEWDEIHRSWAPVPNVTSLNANTTIHAGDAQNVFICTGTITLAFDPVATLAKGWLADFKNDGVGVVTFDPNGGEQIDHAGTVTLGPGESCRVLCDGTQLATLAKSAIPAGVALVYRGGALPAGYLLEDGSTVSRTTYATLFAAIGTTYNTGGEAGTDFRLPNSCGRSDIGDGTGTYAQTVLSAAVNVLTNQITVATNDSFITGARVRYTTSGTAIGGLTNNTDYFVFRTSPTTMLLSTSQANAGIGLGIDLTSAGTGNHTFTVTYTARTLADQGGEEAHLNTAADSGMPTHSITPPSGSNFVVSAPADSVAASGAGPASWGIAFQLTVPGVGASQAHNNMPLYLVAKKMIKT
jgi:microcystin-dependent protein